MIADWLTRPGATLGTGEVNRFELVQAYVAADFDAPRSAGQTSARWACGRKLRPRLDLFADCRPLWLANRRDSFSTSGERDASGAAGDFTGHQFDSRIRYWLAPGRLRRAAPVRRCLVCHAIHWHGHFL